MINLKADKPTRWLLGVSGFLIVLIVACLYALQDPNRAGDQILRRPSTFFTDPTGAKAAFLILQKFLPEVVQSRRSFFQLDEDVDTLIVLNPLNHLAPTEEAQLHQWIENGGQLILALDQDWEIKAGEMDLLDQVEESMDIEDSETNSSEETGFLSNLDIGIVNKHDGLTTFDDLLIEGNKAISLKLEEEISFYPLSIFSMGRGKVMVIPDGHVFSNERLGRSDNAVWLVLACSSWGRGRVFFDEYHHGFHLKQDTGDMVSGFIFSKWGMAFIQLFLAGLLIVIGPWRRFGSILEPKEKQKHDPLELIEARAAMFRNAEARVFGLDMIHRHLLTRLREVGMFSVNQIFARNPEDRGNSPELARYLTLYRKAQETQNLTQVEFIEAASLSGKLLEEYHHE